MHTIAMKIAGRRRWFGYGALGVFLAVVLVLLTVAVPAGAADPPAATTGASAPQRVKFIGNGFGANEMLSFWMTASDRTVTALDSGQADNFGGFTVMITLPTDGMWQVTAHGLTSKHEIVSRYAVGQAAAVTTTTDATIPTDATAQATGGIYPHAVVGQALTIAVNGFGASENISQWQTSPSGEVKALSGIQAESNGQFTTKVTFDTGGFWQVTFHGTTSGHESVRGFTVDATASSTSAPAVVLSTALSGGATPIVLPTFTPAAGVNTNASANPGGANVPTGAGQQILTPSAAQLTPPALALQPPTGTPTTEP